MKKRRIMLICTKSAAFFLAIAVILAAYAYSISYNNALYVSIATACILFCLVAIFYILSNNISKEMRQRWSFYARVIMENKKHVATESESTSNVDECCAKTDCKNYIDYKAELDNIRASYNGDVDKFKNRIEKPHFSNAKPYCDFSVLKTGKIFYSSLVMANSMLYKRNHFGGKVFPAVVVYSTDEYFEQNPTVLKDIARILLKNSDNNILSDESAYFSNVRLEENITDGREVFITTIMMYRYHLPFGCLLQTLTLLPIIAEPNSSSAAFVVDSKYWSGGFVADYFGLSINCDDLPDGN